MVKRAPQAQGHPARNALGMAPPTPESTDGRLTTTRALAGYASGVEESEVRLRLLEDELGALHSGVAGHDARMGQVRGWCLTIASGLLALAVTQAHPILAWSACGAVVAFWFAEAHIASIQRVMIKRLQSIEEHFRGRPPVQALDDVQLELPGMASEIINPASVDTWLKSMKFELDLTLKEGARPYRMLFYALVLVGVVALSVATTALLDPHDPGPHSNGVHEHPAPRITVTVPR